jgi:hypothetical protein
MKLTPFLYSYQMEAIYRFRTGNSMSDPTTGARLKRHLIDPAPLLEEKHLINDLVPAKKLSIQLSLQAFTRIVTPENP